MGAECTGKTTLAQALDAKLDGLWVPEYLRTFCDHHGRTPQAGEQAHILDMQLHQENTALVAAEQQQRAYVFCDTAPLLTAVYSDFIFGDKSLLAPARMLHTRYAQTLLLESDIAWVADGMQREGDHVRAPIQAMLEAELARIARPVAHVIGSGPARLASALKVLQAV